MADQPITNRLNAADPDFDAGLDTLLAFEDAAESAVNETVSQILADVRKRGDAAVIEYSNRFDRLEATSFSDLTIGRERLLAALENISAEQREALETAARRIRDYHRHQLAESWQYSDADGSVLGLSLIHI